MPALSAQRFNRRLLYPIYVMAVVAKAHRLARRAVMEIAEIADEPLLVLRHGFGARDRGHAPERPVNFSGACILARKIRHEFTGRDLDAARIALAAIKRIITGSRHARDEGGNVAGAYSQSHFCSRRDARVPELRQQHGDAPTGDP